MSFRNKMLAMMFLPGLILTGCGGDSEFSLGSGGGGNFNAPPASDNNNPGNDNNAGGGDENLSNISYLPLSVHEKFDDFSGEGSGGLFQGELHFPLIPVHMISLINATTLAPVDNALVTDFRVTVDDVDIDPLENFPVLQKVLGNPVQLRTALVFDLTNSTAETDYAQLFTEAKAYITAAKAHANPIIANQEFVVWGFGHNDPTQANVYEETVGFTDVQPNIELAIDNLQNRVTAGINEGAPSSLHKAVVQAVGRYLDPDAVPPIDFLNDGDNDLYDRVTANGIRLSQMVLFSSGPDTLAELDQATMVAAMQSQGFMKFDPGNPTLSTQEFTNKAIFYYVMGVNEPGNTYQALSNEAEVTRSLTLVNGAYDFTDTLIADQLAAIDARIDLDNQYVYRYAFLPRQGDHTAVFSSRSTNFNYALTTEYDSDFLDALTVLNNNVQLGVPSFELSSVVEITGAEGEFLAAGQASLADVATFRPAVRWASQQYLPGDYVWSLNNGVGQTNPDGSYTVTSIVGASATLQVTNTVRNEAAQITLRN